MEIKQEDQNPDKVISIFGARDAKASQNETADVLSKENFSFEDVVKRNRDAAEKIRKDRQKANQSVIRQYRLKT